MNNDPLVTVVIPTWNRAQLVRKAVGSVIAQTHKNWELFVVDDGSTDDTVPRLTALGHQNVHILQSRHTGHIGQLRNLGASAGHGELVAFLDSDDLWHPQKLEKQVTAIRDSKAGWSYTEYALFNEEGWEIPLRSGRAPAISGHIVRALLQEETGVCPCTLVMRRSLFEAIDGFCEDPRMPYRDDVDIALRLARASEAIALPEKLTFVREHAGRLTAALNLPYEHSATVYEFFVRSESDLALKRLARRCWSRSLAKAGVQRMKSGELGQALSLFRRAAAAGGLRSGLLRSGLRTIWKRLQM